MVVAMILLFDLDERIRELSLFIVYLLLFIMEEDLLLYYPYWLEVLLLIIKLWEP